jgi:hypothetical protein
MDVSQWEEGRFISNRSCRVRMQYAGLFRGISGVAGKKDGLHQKFSEWQYLDE